MASTFRHYYGSSSEMEKDLKKSLILSGGISKSYGFTSSDTPIVTLAQ
jgi:hypothetical protein